MHPLLNALDFWRVRELIIAAVVFGLFGSTVFGPVGGVHAQTPDWVEPRGISVVDLIGVVPDEHLQGSIIVYHAGVAMGTYESGTRVDNTVTVTVKYESNPRNTVVCPAGIGNQDHWPSTIPASSVQIFSGGVDVTDQLNPTYFLYPARQFRPSTNTLAERYPRVVTNTAFNSNGALNVPANMGCIYYLAQSFDDLKATFTFQTPQYIEATHLGTESDTYGSYIGPGFAGFLDSLRNQMQEQFGDRHDDLDINPPAGTEFFLFSYPPTPVEPFGDVSTPNPGGGTYRVRRPSGKLSVDHFHTMGLPLYGQWQDSDQSAGLEFLPFFDDGVRISPPEYFIPTGVDYDPCMTNGGCSRELLQQVYDVQMTGTVHYYNIERISDGLTQIPLRQVGPTWSPLQAAATDWLSTDRLSTDELATDELATGELGKTSETVRMRQPFFAPLNAALQRGQQVYLPLIELPLPADDPTNCPCGWFDADLRMVDFVAGP